MCRHVAMCSPCTSTVLFKSKAAAKCPVCQSTVSEMIPDILISVRACSELDIESSAGPEAKSGKVNDAPSVNSHCAMSNGVAVRF